MDYLESSRGRAAPGGSVPMRKSSVEILHAVMPTRKYTAETAASPGKRLRARALAVLLLLPAPSAAMFLGAAPAAAQRVSAVAPRLLPESIADFGPLVARLSEPGGYFDTDNLISNEASYLHVVGDLARLGVRGGAYIGVGPDQNFSYIAHIRPRIAFIVDIRRDNMLQQLLFKALFAGAPSRIEYLALLTGRPAPPRAARWNDATPETIVAWIDSTPATAASTAAALRLVRRNVGRMGVTLTEADLATIERFHRAFITAGADLRFTSAGRAPRWYYPTLRQLLLERDANGRAASYLAREEAFRFVKSLQRRNLVVPVVGDLAGPHAVAAIGGFVRDHGAVVTAFYVSNAEDYLLRDGSFATYARSVATLPRNRTSVLIRSFFGGPGSHPRSVGTYHSTQLLQFIDDFAVSSAGVRSYRQLVMQYIPAAR
jgi:hypothetical protein